MDTTSMLLQRNTPERKGLRRIAGHSLHEALATPVALELNEGEAWSAGAPRRGLLVRCERGSVWVTVEGDGEDHILTAGETFASSTHGRVAVMALSPAIIAAAPIADLPH
jgi:hypothetical protein